jgi:hypothetical protein
MNQNDTGLITMPRSISLVDEHEPTAEHEDALDDEQSDASDGSGRLTQAARRERLAELAKRIGDRAVHDGDRVVIDVGDPVILHLELDRDGVHTMTWWATALTDNAHHRWRDAAETLLQQGETIYTSALGGGYLVELTRTTQDEQHVIEWASDQGPVDRVNALMAQFPDAVAALPDEPVPDYLIPPEPELPPLGEVDVEDAEEESPEAE